MSDNFFTASDATLIKKESLKAEQLGCLTDAQLRLARDKKFFHCAVPNELGGGMLSLARQMKLFEEASRIDGSFGWTLTLGAGAGLFAAFMNPEFAREVYESRNAFITGSGYPAGTARPAKNKYVINGKWKYASGSPFATLFTASCMIQTGESENPEIRAMAFYPKEVKSPDTWNSYGLKATASHDFEVNDVTIPAERSFIMKPQPAYENYTLYRYPFMPYASASLASSMYGITLGFMDEAQNVTRSDTWPAHSLDEFSEKLHQSVHVLWNRIGKGEKPGNEYIHSVNRAAKTLAEHCRQMALKYYIESGMSVLEQNAPINRYWRDLMTAGQHIMLRFESAE